MTPRQASDRPDPFKALADPTRRRILELLQQREVSAGEIAERFAGISRPAVSRHLRVLREAGLVTAEDVGREQLYRLNRPVLARIHRDWFGLFTPLRDASLAALKRQVEAETRSQPSPRAKRSAGR